MPSLTTHILDLAHGHPASDVTIELYFSESSHEEWQLLKTVVTNADGRLDQPLLSKKEMKIGNYELLFYIGNYFRSKVSELSNPPFLEKVPVRFGIANTESNYHVPLLISPWGYQIYRGS